MSEILVNFVRSLYISVCITVKPKNAMKIALRLVPIIIVAVVLAGCSKDATKSGSVSSATGWDFNKGIEETGGFEVIASADQETGPGLTLIEGGTFTMGKVQDDVMYEWNNVPRRVTVSSFYMDIAEVSNVNYREYLFWLNRIYKENPDIAVNALPDTLVWRDPMAYNEPYMEYYYRHPSYNEYPVVGVNWEKANNYALWRTDRVNEKILIDMGIMEFRSDQGDTSKVFTTEAYLYGGFLDEFNTNPPNGRSVRMEDGFLLPKYRLPTEAEWEFAALGLIGNSIDELVWERKNYPWNGHNVRNDNPRYMGQMRANFIRGQGDMMGVAGALNDNASITAAVKSYWPNDYGLFCMAGNVNEWVLDVYRPLSYEDVSGFRPFRGNVYKKIVMNPTNGEPELDENFRFKTENIEENDAEGRFNYRKADYRNYQDGDRQSSQKRGSLDADPDFKETESMYVFEENDYSSLISDEVRVFKGGSWKDRAYWLSPGERRYLKQSESRDDLGFRCAMTRVGTPTGF